jgi:phosphatidylglycerol:prolipoprotein diacylglycerol transferase
VNGSASYVYSALVITGILVTAFVWGKLTRHDRQPDGRLTIVYFCGLFGALLGAKVAFLLAEGPFHVGDWTALLSGRSITGGLLGGYIAVEIGKRYMGYRRTTGDLFAVLVPIALLLGRIGCTLGGCCPGVECVPAWWALVDGNGVARWPAAPAEFAFNAAFLVWVLVAIRRGWVPGNRFHVYLVAYGLFRFGHEFLRDDPRLLGPIGGYHVIALLLVGFGAWRFVARRSDPESTPFSPARPAQMTSEPGRRPRGNHQPVARPILPAED